MISELGMGAAIIQKKEIGSDQLSPIFGFIILSHSILCAALFLGSPFISRYYSEPRLVSILQVLSGNFLILSMYVIPQSLLIRKMDFKRKSIVDLTATVISGCTALFLALQGYGVWALIWSAIAVHIVNLLGYNILVRNFILPSFTVKGIREFISFGAYTMGSRVLWYFYSKSDIFIGGRILGNQLIGIYSVALELSQIPLDKFMPVINQVAFPAYSSI
jgi:O-antigen/teichoic acid export membrane protein